MNNDTAAYHARQERGDGHMPPGEGAAFANGAAARQPEIERLLEKNIELRQQAECDQREIERLTAQNANLRRWQALGKPVAAAMSIVVDDMQELRAEVERLKADQRRAKMTLHDSTFGYLNPSAAQKDSMTKARSAAADYADVIEHLMPEGPDKTYALRKLREVAMWVNVGITRQPDGTPRE